MGALRKPSTKSKTLAAAAVLTLAAGTTFAAADVAASADEVRPPLVGSSAPEVEVQTVDGVTVALSELVSSQPSIVIFYRGGW